MNKLLLCVLILGCVFTTNAASLEAIENPPVDLGACDEDNGVATFDLTQNNTIVLGSQNPADFNITYHLTQADAENNTNAIPNPNAYTSSDATVFVRVEETANTDLFEIGVFNVIVLFLPDISSNISDLIGCDLNQDGFISIDLASKQDEILLGQDSIDFIITYHTSFLDATDGINSITTPFNYTNQIANTNETIWVRVQRNDGTINDCVAITSFNIIIVSPPEINPSGMDINITVCNDDSVNEDPIGITTFDLTTFEDDITGGDVTLMVSYFASLADLNANIPIADPSAYTNTSNPQTIQFTVSTFVFTSCATQGSFDIEVLPLPSPVPNTELAQCDDDADGFASFDLFTLNDVIANGEVVNIFYFETASEAVIGDPSTAIDPNVPYNNSIPSLQTLYVRVESTVSIIDGLPCFVIVEVNLVIENCVDTDDDGIPDEEEDLNGNGDLEDDDTDNDDIPNYLDDDDDGDLVMTIDEITGIGAGIAPQDFIDTDDDTIENYLDDDDDGDGVLTIDEDYNNSGSPLDDDINDNDIPDFLDPDVALSTDEFEIANFAVYPNPATSVVTLENIDVDATITVYDTLGRTVLFFTNDTTERYSIDISTLTNGLYFISVSNRRPVTFIKN
ncbi:T9SS type A sorting domain-containing protein [uncultured Dokdonia sp.]|uniref:T9SS type A sorting domain-containing protein n=1 Tax=uncultured Dokdonia sp. TaxID=575653 RepID=UPI00261EFC3E|nr:T9SS type A sorting domain-containing protein [uncultured Dokdonia sp.]